MYTAFRHNRLLDLSSLSQRTELLMVIVVDGHPLSVDFLMFLEFCKQVSRIHIARQIGGTVVDPSIFVDLSAEKLAAVRSLFTKDLCFFQIILILEQQRAALSHRIVFRLMEAVAAKIADRSKGFSLVVRAHALCRILYNLQVMAFCNIHDGIHFTGNARIVNRNNRFCFFGDGILNLGLVDVHCIRTDIHVDDFCSAQNEGICSGNKRVGRHDHFVARLNLRQVSCHFQCMGAGCRKHRMFYVEIVLHPGRTFLRKRTVAAQLVVFLCRLADVFQFCSNKRWFIKLYHCFFLIFLLSITVLFTFRAQNKLLGNLIFSQISVDFKTRF